MNQMTSQMIDMDLVANVVDNIPAMTWEQVKEGIIVNLVDQMPSDILIKLTGDPTGFEKAEAILDEYYVLPDRQEDLIADSFKIIGVENPVYFLDSLQLDKYVESKPDNAPCSIDP